MKKYKCDNEECNCNPCECNPCNCTNQSKYKRKFFLLAILGLMIFTLTACSNDEKQNNIPEGAVRSEITVWGMTCGRCINQITNVLTNLDGVIDVTVDMREENVTVIHYEHLELERIKEVIAAEGYSIP